MEHKATECLGVRMATKSFGKRRWLGAALAALCTIALALVLAPMPALADEDLQAKVDKGGTVQLSADVAADIVVSKDVTLDLNGRTLTNASGDTITVKAGANLTVIGKGTVDNVTNGKAALSLEEGATATLKGGTFTRSKEDGTDSSAGTNSYYTIINHGDLTIDGATVENKGGHSSVIDNGWYSGKPNSINPKLTVESGTISGGRYVKNDSYGTMVVNGGTFKGGVNGIFLNWNELTINGGTFENTQNAPCAIVQPCTSSKDAEKGILTIAGGDFTKAGPALIGQPSDYTGDYKSTITGGSYAAEVKVLAVADGYTLVANTDGTSKVVANTKPVVNTSNLPSGTLGVDYYIDLSGAGIPDPVLNVEGLPDGLSFNGIAISGTPTKAGDFTVTVTAKNAAGTTTKELTFTVVDPAKPVQVYRLYNKYDGDHMFTTSKSEYDLLVSLGWNGEGKAWSAPGTSDTKVYRLYNPYSGDHFFTTSEEEYNNLGEIGWNQEGIAFYSADKDSGVAIYRLFNPYLVRGTHLFTTNKAEYDYLSSLGWSPENVAFYGLKDEAAKSE
ncbi:hypothetical protein DW781_09480 [Olsenella sp. AM30-3LB]|nr:hypothetical protein DW781_09480 [Olsenella sp. AM30-3LB]